MATTDSTDDVEVVEVGRFPGQTLMHLFMDSLSFVIETHVETKNWKGLLKVADRLVDAMRQEAGAVGLECVNAEYQKNFYALSNAEGYQDAHLFTRDQDPHWPPETERLPLKEMVKLWTMAEIICRCFRFLMLETKSLEAYGQGKADKELMETVNNFIKAPEELDYLNWFSTSCSGWEKKRVAEGRRNGKRHRHEGIKLAIETVLKDSCREMKSPQVWDEIEKREEVKAIGPDGTTYEVFIDGDQVKQVANGDSDNPKTVSIARRTFRTYFSEVQKKVLAEL